MPIWARAARGLYIRPFLRSRFVFGSAFAPEASEIDAQDVNPLLTDRNIRPRRVARRSPKLSNNRESRWVRFDSQARTWWYRHPTVPGRDRRAVNLPGSQKLITNGKYGSGALFLRWFNSAVEQCHCKKHPLEPMKRATLQNVQGCAATTNDLSALSPHRPNRSARMPFCSPA